MADVDAALLTALRLAKSKKLFFAFIPKGTDGALIVSKKKIPPKEIAEARKELGGGAPISGKCFGPINNLVFQVAKAAPPTLGAALKKVVKREAGLTIVPQVQLAADADEDEAEDTAAAAPAAPEAAAAVAAAGGGALTSATVPDTRATASQALNVGPWQAARQKAINDLKALATKVAGTRHADAVGVLKEINAIIAKLPARPAPQEIDQLEALIRSDEAISAAEECPKDYHDVTIREPLLQALEQLRA